MSSYFYNNTGCVILGAWLYWFIVIVFLNPTHAQQLLQSRIVFVSTGTQFSPANMPVQLLATTFTVSRTLCAAACNRDVRCRILDFGVILPQQCRLFEGDMATMGTIIPSPSVSSTVGVVQLSSDIFAGHGLPCSSVCDQSRYLVCNSNSTCQCVPHTYWDGTMCVAQISALGASCQQNISMCRADLNYTCLRFNQCGPLSLYSGTTIADQTTVIAGSASVGLNLPQEIIVDASVPGSILVADGLNNQVVRLSDGSSGSNNNSVVVRNWTSGNQLLTPYNMFLDINGGNNLYVSDTGNHRVVMFTAMQSNTPPPRVIAGTGSAGTGANQLNMPCGLALDRQGNMFIAEYGNHRVMLYAPNATSGTMIAGSGTAGSSSLTLRNPGSLFLDEHNSWLYIADVNNHRIQRFSLNNSLPLNGTTVAGGNNAGIGSHQLNQPYGVWVSIKTGAIYIADSNNHRIQRWSPGATIGVTIAGSSSGISGTNATMLKNPYRLTANTNETILYVSDGTNRRVQRFQLI